MADLKTSIILDLIDRVSGPARRVTQSLQRIGVSQSQLKAVSQAAGRVGNDLGRVTREAGKLVAGLTVLGGAGLWFVKSQLVDTAAQFEKFRTVLETVEGSSAKASASMDWVSDFAAKTPYELDEVMESFVRLRAYGLDPTNGLLRSLGDTASAMGKPIMQAVEAIADAITGENERLKEFGIRAEVSGNRIRYSYADQAGKQQFKIVDKNNRAMIQSTLEAIWNEKYAGAMDKQSRTWAGMVSNLSDQWTRFKVKVMEAGLFDWLKGKLGGLLSTLDRMAANGSLQKLANDVGVKLKDGFIQAWQAGEALWRVLSTIGSAVAAVADALGGYENLAKGVVALMAGKFLLSVGMLATSFFNLGRAAIPVAIAGLRTLIPLLTQAAVAGAGVPGALAVGGTAAAGGAGVAAAGGAGIASAGAAVALPVGMAVGFKFLADSANARTDERLAGLDLTKLTDRLNLLARQDGTTTHEYRAGLARLREEERMSGELKITIDQQGRVAVTKLTGRNLDIDVDSGRTMTGF